eukprot:Rhum_TRINITY_DN14274_c0_g2::Rhum_TRINITY_DN14274_c0_g2_i2::g.76673::m.76673
MSLSARPRPFMPSRRAASPASTAACRVSYSARCASSATPRAASALPPCSSPTMRRANGATAGCLRPAAAAVAAVASASASASAHAAATRAMALSAQPGPSPDSAQALSRMRTTASRSTRSPLLSARCRSAKSLSSDASLVGIGAFGSVYIVRSAAAAAAAACSAAAAPVASPIVMRRAASAAREAAPAASQATKVACSARTRGAAPSSRRTTTASSAASDVAAGRSGDTRRFSPAAPAPGRSGTARGAGAREDSRGDTAADERTSRRTLCRVTVVSQKVPASRRCTTASLRATASCPRRSPLVSRRSTSLCTLLSWLLAAGGSSDSAVSHLKRSCRCRRKPCTASASSAYSSDPYTPPSSCAWLPAPPGAGAAASSRKFTDDSPAASDEAAAGFRSCLRASMHAPTSVWQLVVSSRTFACSTLSCFWLRAASSSDAVSLSSRSVTRRFAEFVSVAQSKASALSERPTSTSECTTECVSGRAMRSNLWPTACSSPWNVGCACPISFTHDDRLRATCASFDATTLPTCPDNSSSVSSHTIDGPAATAAASAAAAAAAAAPAASTSPAGGTAVLVPSASSTYDDRSLDDAASVCGSYIMSSLFGPKRPTDAPPPPPPPRRGLRRERARPSSSSSSTKAGEGDRDARCPCSRPSGPPSSVSDAPQPSTSLYSPPPPPPPPP